MAFFKNINLNPNAICIIIIKPWFIPQWRLGQYAEDAQTSLYSQTLPLWKWCVFEGIRAYKI